MKFSFLAVIFRWLAAAVLLGGCGYVGFELQALSDVEETDRSPAGPAVDASDDAAVPASGTGAVEVAPGPDAGPGAEPCDGACDSAALPAVAVATCQGDRCVPALCEPGFADCDGLSDNGCEADLNSAEHCGVCGHQCQADQATMGCAAGACVVAACDAGFSDCDGQAGNGCERAVTTLTDCGACGVPCGAPYAEVSCASGRCELTACMPGYASCDGDALGSGCETPTSTLTDCGGCDQVCSVTAGTASCAGGICTGAGCQAGFADCDGDSLTCETNLSTLSDCGACGATCGDEGRLPFASARCDAGSCRVDQCDAQRGDCDGVGSNGCETSLNTLSDCGGCGISCGAPYATTSCASGTCAIAACQPGFADCNGQLGDGCEASLLGEFSCGRCGEVCSGSERCVEGSCVGFTYSPVNVPLSGVDPNTVPPANYTCGETRFDSNSLTFSNACGQPTPSITVVPQAGADLVVLAFRELSLSAGSRFRVWGDRPVALAVVGDATIAGTFDVSASGGTSGPGGNDSCGASTGGSGTGSSSGGGGGGGGGGFGTSGGRGGYGDNSGNQGSAGGARGSSALSPLQGGCGGGLGGGCNGQRGAGGGAIQLSVGGTLTLTGSVLANGSGGTNGCGSEGGGTGGGAGGGILLEADTLFVSGNLRAEGGNGGRGSGGGAGGLGGTASRTAQAGQSHGTNGGGGGGGAVGRIRLLGHSGCNLAGLSHSPGANISCP